MEEPIRSPAYFAIITGPILDNRELAANAKILYASITSMTDSKGYCWASNQYLADRFGWGERTVTRLIAQLQELGFIRTVMVLNEQTRKMERRIYIGNDAAEGVAKIGYPCQNWRVGVAKNGDPYYMLNNKLDNTPLNPPTGGNRTGSRKGAKKTAAWMPDRFEAFWAWYRTHVRNEDRQGAIRAWDRLKPDEELIARIGRALQKQLLTDLWASGKGRPYAATYLNNARWEDAEGQPPAPSAPSPEQEVFGWQ